MNSHPDPKPADPAPADPMTPSDVAAPATAESATLRTKPNRHFPFLSRHPWVLATAIASPRTAAASSSKTSQQKEQRTHEKQDGSLAASDGAIQSSPADQTPGDVDDLAPTVGESVELLDHDGNWIARGLCNPASRLRLRLYSYSRDQEINDALFAQRIDEAVARRRLTPAANLSSAGERLIFSESDRISGLIVDRYADCLSIQFTAAALLSRGPFLIEEVLKAAEKYNTPCARVIARVDAATARHEGITAEQIAEVESWSRGISSPPVTGAGDSSEVISSEADTVWYHHNDLEMAIDLRDGQKTGGYLDQQANHAEAARYMSGRRVLDICTYTGGFALAAAQGGASEVIGVDSSEKALEMARRNARKNSLDQVQFERADCFDDLKARGTRKETFDAVILDPPRFAGARRQVDAALRAYGRLNMSALDLLPPGGILVTCSCSGHVSRADFLNMLVDAGRKRQRDIVILQSRGPSPDHPCAVSCPESDYLKCVIAQVQ
ncbi:Ribosomal RNA large subunit methyltransferase I [Allorhodopirellula heiligendammensis]|uniref:Ribosomal RNA large subunit methyltransferase I n=2 Tax=Allorhodopirellula heiligendammensis TaxID=2714739 RepID=A0A5C6BH40_9BACT|nr:Ribosomal RNA large subunit methyltransferase I [Allorhodopirellula heiligendammensis]